MSVLDRSELGTIPKSAKKFNDIRIGLSELKGPSSFKNGDTAAGILVPIADAFLKEIYDIADKANELQYPPEKPSAGPKTAHLNNLAYLNDEKAVFLGFKPKIGGSLISVVHPELVHIFSVIYSNQYLRNKFEDPKQGLLNAELAKYGIKLSKKIGRHNKTNNEIFERQIVIGNKIANSVANIWYLNQDFVFVFDSPAIG
jgi:hypothetical protein